MKPASTGQRLEVERSISLVRLVLTMAGVSVAVAARAVDTSVRAIGLSTLIVVVGAGGLTAARWLERQRFTSRWRGVAFQAFDSMATLGLVLLVDSLLSDSGWVLLAVPIVISSLRLGVVGTFGTWAATSAGYLLMLQLGLLTPGRDAISSSLVFQRPGALLALTASVAVLTKWLQAAWIGQAEATEEVERRLSHVLVLEQATQSMLNVGPDEVVASCRRSILGLDFDAAGSISADGLQVREGGHGLVPSSEVPERPGSGELRLTEWWDGRGGVVYSAAVLEPHTDTVMVGWSTSEPREDQLEAFVGLVRFSASSVEVAMIHDEARFQADHDALTGLANRASLDRHLEWVCGQEQPIALLFVDLDYFKKVNDSYGHQAGDEVLRVVSDNLYSVLVQLEGENPPTAESADDLAFAARYGGDELVVVLSGQIADRASDCARLLLESSTTPTLYEGAAIRVGLSIGIGLAMGPVAPGLIEQLADKALYRAKEAGRGTSRLMVYRPKTSCNRPRPAAEPAEIG